MVPERHVPDRNRERSTTVRWVLDLVRTELTSGAFPDGVLPSEDALIRTYGVSRGIIRQVLLVLQEQGMIERVRGAGTFALTPSVWMHEIEVPRPVAGGQRERDAGGDQDHPRQCSTSDRVRGRQAGDQLR
jgi:DNA-binding GntR family transcriptional regulator